MKNRIPLILLFILSNYCAQSSSLMDTTIIEILDDTLSNIYYHQEDFAEPTRLVYPNLSYIEGYAYFHQNTNLISVDLPTLNTVGDYVYISGNEKLEYIKMSSIDTIHNYLYVNGNIALTDLDICSLGHITSAMENDDLPYYSIANNTPIVDTEPFCFSQGPPENLTLSDSTIVENSNPDTYISTLNAIGNYPSNEFNYYLTYSGTDNDHFQITNDSLKSATTFDFEVKEIYNIEIGVYNQLGETITQEFIIRIEDIDNEGIQIIEILDDTLDLLYYHQENFSLPTRLVFPNLTTVLGIAYFHQNTNLLSVDLPHLSYVGDNMYFSGNEVLEYILAPVTDTIHNNLYISGNTALTQLDICGLTHILPSADNQDIPYYYIANNTTAVDTQPFCFSLGEPQNLILTSTVIEENAPPETYIGTLSATGNYPINEFTYFLTDSDMDNEFFTIHKDSLKSNSTFDYEVKDQYMISIGVYNQLGETITQEYTITIDDILNEGMQVIEILEDTLSEIYYHQENFTQPTRLVFPNLTTVLGYTYFHQNINLLSVDLPLLNYVGDYTYLHGNQVLEYVKMPVIDTIYNYLYASSNTILTELDVCSLSHIISTDINDEAYYYIHNNPLLNLATTCLDSSILEFSPLDSLIQSNLILAGNFESDSDDAFLHFIIDDGEEVTETEDFIIIDDGLYLTKELIEYTDTSYPLTISSIRIDDNPNTTLNEKIEQSIDLDLTDKEVVSNTAEIENTNHLIAYPNPTDGILTIHVDRNSTVSLLNHLGIRITDFSLSRGLNKIDLSGIGTGLYFLRTDLGRLTRVIVY